MKLVWHAVKKDVRRMALPTAIWLALIVVPTAAFAWMPMPVAGDHLNSAIDGWSQLLAIWIRLLVVLQIVIGYLLAGFVVLEDPLVGSTAFWMTRPLRNGRLLAAKAIAASLLFVVAPVIALMPVWLACGFGLPDLAMAASEIARRFAAMALTAVALASVVATLPQFLLGTLAVGAAFSFTGVIPEPLWQSAPVAVRLAREMIVLGGIVPMLALIALHQFLTRRTARTWTLIAGALLMAAIIRTTWPWQYPVPNHVPRPVTTVAPERAAGVVIQPTFTQFLRNPKAMPNLVGTTVWTPEQFQVPVFAWTTSGEAAMRTAGRWEAEAGLRLLGSSHNDAPLPWQLTMTGRPPSERSAERSTFTGTLDIWDVRPRILGELPLRLGARLSHPAGRTEIVGFQWHEGRLDRIVIQETESRIMARAGLTSNWTLPDSGKIRHIDRYFLVNRSTGTTQAGGAGDVGKAEMNAIAIRYRSLGYPRTDDVKLDEAVLVKVRFECLDRFNIPLEVRGMAAPPPPRPRP